MIDLSQAHAGRFCWLTLAASDGESAIVFYRAQGGRYTRLRLGGPDG